MTDSREHAWDIDLASWPVIVVRPRPDVSDGALREALASYDRLLGLRQGPYVLVMDNRHAPGLTAPQRRIIGEYNAAHEQRTRARCRGTAFVMTSAFVRGLMTAVFWLKQPPTETRVFESFDEAMLWAFRQANSLPSLTPTADGGAR